MNFWSPFPFVRVTFVFAAGILLATIIPHTGYLIEATVAAVVLHFAVWLIAKKMGGKFRGRLLGSISLLLVMFMGFSYTNLRTDQSEVDLDNVEGYSGSIISIVETRGEYERATLKLGHLITSDSIYESDSKVLLYLRRDSLFDEVKYGDHLVVNSRPIRISPPTNPGAFDFSTYWKRKGILFQDFVDTEEFEVGDNNPSNPVFAFALSIRSYCQGVIENSVKGESQRAIALALVLGVKNGLDNDLKEAYSAAGAMHVLAVSGLHVGILYLFILYLFRPIRDHRYGNVIIGLFSITFLWLYALVTGFSPSVQRAVVMFTIFIIGRTFGRSRNIYNSLALSAFILLVIDPMMIFNVGFQLSYLAVFGIVFLHPKIYQLWSPNNLVINKAWEISCVSISAQLATFPLGLYYFNQFPVLFLLSNLVVIPAAFLVLILGISTLLTASVGISFHLVIGEILNTVLWLMNEFVYRLEQVGFSVLDGVHLTEVQTVLIYLGMAWLIALFLLRKFRFALLAGLALVGISYVRIIDHLERRNTTEVVFYDIAKTSLVDFREGFTAQLVGSSVDENFLDYVVLPHRSTSNLESDGVDVNSFAQWLQPMRGVEMKYWQGKSFVRVSERFWDEYQFNEKLEVDFLILSEGAVRDLNEISELIIAKQIVIDSSNSAYLSRQLQAEALKKGYTSHSTKLDGALTVQL